MEANEIAFLILSVGAFMVLAGTLAWASHVAPGNDLGKSG